MRLTANGTPACSLSLLAAGVKVKGQISISLKTEYMKQSILEEEKKKYGINKWVLLSKKSAMFFWFNCICIKEIKRGKYFNNINLGHFWEKSAPI